MRTLRILVFVEACVIHWNSVVWEHHSQTLQGYISECLGHGHAPRRIVRVYVISCFPFTNRSRSQVEIAEYSLVRFNCFVIFRKVVIALELLTTKVWAEA